MTQKTYKINNVEPIEEILKQAQIEIDSGKHDPVIEFGYKKEIIEEPSFYQPLIAGIKYLFGRN